MPHDEPNDRPFLFIPHFPPPKGIGADTGQLRPVPSPVIYYLCNGIHFLSEYQPGQKLSFAVDVANWGGGAADSLAMVSTFWSPPLSGAAIPDPKKFLGFGKVPLPAQGGRNSLTLTVSIPPDAPSHICLLAKVFHSLDMAPVTLIGGKEVEVADPVHERHWAQHNICAIPSATPAPINFMASNPTAEEREFQLRIQPVSSENWDSLRAVRAGEPVTTDARIRLSGRGENDQLEGRAALTHDFVLAPGEDRELSVLIESEGRLDKGTYAGYEVVQQYRERPTGGFAVVLTGDDS